MRSDTVSSKRLPRQTRDQTGRHFITHTTPWLWVQWVRNDKHRPKFQNSACHSQHSNKSQLSIRPTWHSKHPQFPPSNALYSITDVQRRCILLYGNGRKVCAEIMTVATNRFLPRIVVWDPTCCDKRQFVLMNVLLLPPLVQRPIVTY